MRFRREFIMRKTKFRIAFSHFIIIFLHTPNKNSAFQCFTQNVFLISVIRAFLRSIFDQRSYYFAFGEPTKTLKAAVNDNSVVRTRPAEHESVAAANCFPNLVIAVSTFSLSYLSGIDLIISSTLLRINWPLPSI